MKSAIAPPLMKIAFTGDFLRFSPQGGRFESPQLRNVKWLQEILTAGAAWRQAGRDTELVFPAAGEALDGRAAGLNRKALADYAADPELAWAARFARDSIDVFPKLLDKLLAADLVIGFELPPALKKYLHRHGRPYLSLHIHPLRLLQDLCFGATTNQPAVAALLEGQVVPAEHVAHQVHHHRALCRFHQLPLFVLPPGLPVMVGQTARDSVLIEGGRFSTWPDQADALSTHLREHDTVVLLEHPYRADSLDIAEYLRSTLGKTVFITNANGYALLLTNAAIPSVLTLASSLGVEAQAMGLRTHFLLGDPRQRLRTEGIDLGPEAPLGHGLLTTPFWQALLDGQLPPEGVAHDRPPFSLGEDYLRSCLDAWSYRMLKAGLAGASNRTCLMPTAGLSQARQRELLGGLGNKAPHTPPPSNPAWRQAGIDLLELDRPIDLEQERVVHIGHSTSSPYLACGFHPIESWGAWSSQPHAQLSIAIAARAVAAKAVITLRMRLRAYEGLLDRCPVVRIRSAHAALGCAFFRPERPEAQDVSVSFDALDTCMRIHLEITDTVSPADLGSSKDERTLGFLLMALELRCDERSVAGNAAAGDSGYTVSGLGGTPVRVKRRAQTRGTGA